MTAHWGNSKQKFCLNIDRIAIRSLPSEIVAYFLHFQYNLHLRVGSILTVTISKCKNQSLARQIMPGETSSPHVSLNREGRWGPTDDFSSNFPCSPLPSGSWRAPGLPVHSLMLSSSVCHVDKERRTTQFTKRHLEKEKITEQKLKNSERLTNHHWHC